MAISRWQFINSETPEFRNRYFLKVDGSREDITNLYKKYKQNLWVPFALRGDEYSWGVYLDGMEDEGIEVLKDYLASITHPEKKISPPTAEKEKASSAKMEIISSTWDWQKMQMEKGMPAEKESSEHKKESTAEDTTKKQPEHKTLSSDIEEKKQPGVTEDIQKEKIHHPPKENVEVNEIISELNKILTNITESDEAVSQAVQEHVESTPEPVKSKEPAESLSSDTSQEKDTTREEDSGISSQPSVQEMPESQEDSDNSRMELSNMFMKTVEDKEQPASQPPEESDSIKAPPPEKKEEEPQLVEQKIPLRDESLKAPASDPTKIRVGVIVPADEKEIGGTFVSNVTEKLSKISKGNLQAEIVLSVSIDGNAFDPQSLFQQVIDSNAEMVFLVGLEQSSTYKIGRLVSLINDKNIEKKSIDKKLVDKNFLYLDIAVELMLTKRKIIDKQDSSL